MSNLLTMTGPYVPRKHMKFRRWAFVFTSRVAKDPASVGLSDHIAEDLRAAFQRFNELYDFAQIPSQRTVTSVSAMNQARKVLEKKCRMYAQRIKNDPEVDDLVKRALFLRLGRHRRMEISALSSQPILHVVSASSGRHVLRWWDNRSAPGRRKPKDAAALLLFAVVADRQCGDPRQAQYVGTYTRQPMRIDWPASTAGKTISYFGRWITASGKEGPWSAPMSMQIAFGGMILAEIDKQRDAIRRAG